MKVLVIGLDGATFNVLNPLMKEGKLPNIKKLVQNGVHGILRSSIPPATFPAWKCYSTGMKPPKLGGYYFLSFSEGKLRNPHLNVKEIWDYLSERNFRVCVINTPTTYPAKPVNMAEIEIPALSKQCLNCRIDDIEIREIEAWTEDLNAKRLKLSGASQPRI